MYKILKKSPFESLTKFEQKVNDQASQGWRVVSVFNDQGRTVVMFEKKNEHY